MRQRISRQICRCDLRMKCVSSVLEVNNLVRFGDRLSSSPNGSFDEPSAVRAVGDVLLLRQGNVHMTALAGPVDVCPAVHVGTMRFSEGSYIISSDKGTSHGLGSFAVSRCLRLDSHWRRFLDWSFQHPQVSRLHLW